MNPLRLALSTFILRPYVLAFLLIFLLCSFKVFGWKRALLFIAYAYPVAFALEAISIRWGFPYGMYVYHMELTAGRELWVLGVPWMSTLSYVFLSFFSYRLCVIFFTRTPIAWPFLCAAAMMLIDIVVDPVTLAGKRWFLGDLYHYPEPGFYFGVPLVNFLGWGLCGFLISFPFAVEEMFNRRELRRWRNLWRWDTLAGWTWVGGAFYMAAVAFWIGEDRLGIVAASVGSAVGLCLSMRRKFLLDQEQIIEEPAL